MSDDVDRIEQLINEAEAEKGSPLTGEEVDALVEANLDPNAPAPDPGTLVFINPILGAN